MSSYHYEPNLKYADTHEWARQEDSQVVVGISDAAQDMMSDIVFVELPDVGLAVSAGEAVAVVESVKAAEDIYAPVSGSVSAVNEELNDTPELVNTDPYGAWFLKIEVEDGAELEKLMDADAYSAFVDSQQ
ncbi:MAG: glycine cleavage system protein GcvH [Caldilineaceae bacterium SB0675_bin_29]|uniref:Glycine cleavage system H protein n=1 Tax=Caldilineaceae bacterium SB0675_bin_29 TaxID=2605266 RepID=A0A6B1FXQ3_9CHLR|nr:glycine cleavage system protein GcvH [Caldilineaceae bacterium SB0675_bin_29]